MIKLTNTLLLQRAVRAIANFIPEANFRFNEKGLSVKSLDPSQIVLVDYHAPKSLFQEFKVEGSYVGVDVEELNKILKRAQPSDMLEMDLNDTTLQIFLRGEIERQFHLSLIEVGEDDPPEPKHEAEATVEVKARALQEMMQDAKLFGSSVVLRVQKEKFLVEAKGNQGTLKAEVRLSDLVKVKAKKEVTSKYSLNFLENIVKEADPESTILLELQSEAPVKISYPIGQTQITYYLAHMIL